MKGSKRSNPSLLYSFLPIIESGLLGRHSGPHLKCFFRRPLLRARFYCTFTSLSDFEFPFKAISPMTMHQSFEATNERFFSDGKGIQSSYLLCLLKANDVPVGMLIEVVAFLLQFVNDCISKLIKKLHREIQVNNSFEIPFTLPLCGTAQ